MINLKSTHIKCNNMVLAYQIKEPVEAKKLKLKKINIEEPKDDEIRVKNHFVAVNHFDVHYRNGTYPLNEYPQTIGISGSGEVTKIGKNVKNYKIGDMVSYATNFLGSYAEEVNIKSFIAFTPDKNIALEAQTAINVPSLLAHGLLTNVYRVKKNDNIFITGATGGVGNILVQILNSFGHNVYGVVGSDAKISHAKSFGCKEALNYNKEDFIEQAMSITKNKGATVIFDSLGEKFYQKAINLLNLTGIIVNYGDTTGIIKDIRTLDLWKKSLFFTRPHLSIIRGFNLDRVIANEYIYNSIRDRKIIPKYEVVDFKKIPEAHQRIENGEVIGNLVAKL